VGLADSALRLFAITGAVAALTSAVEKPNNAEKEIKDAGHKGLQTLIILRRKRTGRL
jgi:hypothetical protein